MLRNDDRPAAERLPGAVQTHHVDARAQCFTASQLQLVLAGAEAADIPGHHLASGVCATGPTSNVELIRKVPLSPSSAEVTIPVSS